MLSTIILAAKKASDLEAYNQQMLPVRGKPALDWVISDYLQNDEVILVLNNDNKNAIDYFSNKYANLKIAWICEKEELNKYKNFSILNSLMIGLNQTTSDNVQVVLGDTLCRRNATNNEDIILTSRNFSSSDRWCLIDKNEKGFVKSFYDKQKNIDISNKEVLIGYYQFKNVSLLKELTQEALINGKKELSDILIQYNKTNKIKAEQAKVWFDLGHKAGIIKAQNYFFNSRDFNSIQTNPVLGTITKSSTKIQKLADEFAWYNNLPDEIKILAPRAISFQENLDSASLTMEMYGYNPLSELFILGNMSLEEWELIIEKLFEIHKYLEKHKGNLSKENFNDLYLQKTWQRLKEMQAQDSYWTTLLRYDTIFVNDVEYKNIKHFKTRLIREAKKLQKNIEPTVMHGDYCFSNILFDTNSFLCRLIDPRGRLSEQTIYGDCRYDIAKLRHSAVGCYDFIVHGLFSIKENKNHFIARNDTPHFIEELTTFFDKSVIKFGYDLFEIKLVEAALFLSMIPLHKDDMERQKMFYLKALIKLNEIFGEEHE